MSWLLFLDESGHDHKITPYEVRGGIAVSDERLWPFIQAVKQAEVACFGARLHEYKSELKGARLLKKKRFEWAGQEPPIPVPERRALSRAFLTKGLEGKPPSRREFTAYGQASLAMAHRLMEILQQNEARVFATAISRAVTPEPGWRSEEFLRKDHVYLFERFYYFLEAMNDHGLIVMDECEKREDRHFVRRMERYFTQTVPGIERTSRITPAPLFVSSDMAYPIQAADICVYCVNWGYRLPEQGMDAPVREEIARMFFEPLQRLRYRGDGYKEGRAFPTYGIVYVPNPYGKGKW